MKYDALVAFRPSGFDDIPEPKLFLVVNPKLTYSQGIKTEPYNELRWSIEQSIDGTLDHFELE